jgi:branched-chain amino acid transport system substrate-binding protein
MIQFVQNPTNSIIYFPWGPLLSAFTEIGQEASHGVISSTVIGLPQDDIGADFRTRYKAKWGPEASEIGATVTYSNVYHWALASAMAGGSAEPGNIEQARKVATWLKRIIFRGVQGAIHYHPEWQSAIPYPDLESRDPSLGMPHLFYQIKEWKSQTRVLVSPPPYNTGEFELPPYYKA